MGWFVGRGLAVSLFLLAGCASPATLAPASYACIDCDGLADGDPTRSHFENFLAVSPADDQHLVVAACSFDGERFQVTAHSSFDGGDTWAVAALPYGDRAPIGHPLATANFAADPGVAISRDGQTVVVAAVALTTVPLQQLNGNLPLQSQMFVARSTDGGRTFPPEQAVVLQASVQAYPAVQDFSDHPRITVGDDGTFLVMWGSLDLPDPTKAARFLATQDVVLATSLEVRFSASTDGGATWSSPAIAYQDTDLHYYPPSPVILADGRWMVMPSEYNGGEGDAYLSLSEDWGATWSWDATPMQASGFGTPAAAVDGRIAYSYNAPVPGATGVVPVQPMLAVAAAPGAPWQLHALTDGPMAKRMGIENMVAFDGRGAIHVLYLWAPQDGALAEIRVATLHSTGGLTQTTLEGNVTDARGFGHYAGFAATPVGVVATWPRAEVTPGQLWAPGGSLLTARVEWQP